MEMFLALVVMIAVIFFGALISKGNERQRRAIDNLRDQVVLWAMQDLRIKREKLALDVSVEDPVAWLSHVSGKVAGQDLKLEVIEFFGEPKALVCHSGGGGRVVFTPLSPTTIREMSHARRDRLAYFAVDNPLLSLPRGIRKYEISALNSGMLFDLELSLAWEALTGQQAEHMDRLWLYILP